MHPPATVERIVLISNLALSRTPGGIGRRERAGDVEEPLISQEIESDVVRRDPDVRQTEVAARNREAGPSENLTSDLICLPAFLRAPPLEVGSVSHPTDERRSSSGGSSAATRARVNSAYSSLTS